MAREQRNALPKDYALDEFTIERVLGAGGFGITYLALEEKLNRRVAIKEYLPGNLAMRGTDGSSVHPVSSEDKGDYDYGLGRFRDEARTLVNFHHPNIVAVHRFLEANNTAYLVMQYVEGESLYDILKRDKRLPEHELREILLPLLDGLEKVHAAGFLHRDIKPGNIFIQADGTPVLLDFGAARQALGEKSESITSIVTAGYAPFEQYASRGRQGAWTDLYAMGATLYRAVTGAKPMDAPDRIAGEDFLLAVEAGRKRYSTSFLEAIDWALNMKASERPQSVAEWQAAFGQPKASDARRPASAQPAGRHLGLAIAVALVVLVAAGVGAWVTLEPLKEGPRTEPLRVETKRVAEETRRKTVEASRRKAAEAARKIAEEARRKAAEDAKRRAVTEAKRKAAEEASKKAGEVERKAREEALRQAEKARRRAAARKGAAATGDDAPNAKTPKQKRIEELERRVRKAEKRASGIEKRSKKGRGVRRKQTAAAATTATSLRSSIAGSTLRFNRLLGGEMHSFVLFFTRSGTVSGNRLIETGNEGENLQRITGKWSIRERKLCVTLNVEAGTRCYSILGSGGKINASGNGYLNGTLYVSN